ncbi:MAG: homoserine O-acetyltransferase [Phycisphaerae bacterium]|nr:homoserine O-acetyltransferase [Phycisphaerae bacterium]
MTDDFFTSSDTVRQAAPLKHVQTVSLDGSVELELGDTLPSVTVAYETYGRLNADRSNGILICHAISGDSHVARHDEEDDPGWWDVAVGPGKPIDTDRFFVICPNVLGGCRGTTGPNCLNPATGRPYGPDFPRIAVGDMVRVQRRLLDHLGIETLIAAVGGSMGGHQVLAWARYYPECLWGAVLIATSARLTAQALAFDVVGRNAIIRDPNFRDGRYYETGASPEVGLAIARMIGHITYVSRQAMDRKFDPDRLSPRDVQTGFENLFSVGSYLGHQGAKFVERFDANSYITLSTAMDLFDLGDTRDKLARALDRTPCRWLVLSFSSDWLFTPAQSRELVDALIATDKPVSYCNVESDCGHDAFLLPDQVDSYGALMRAFLEDLSREGDAEPIADEAPYGHAPTSIFRSHRLDYDRIVELIPAGAGVLDLGCGKGSLLARLKRRGHYPLLGVELDEKAIIACVGRGLSVIQTDLNEGLACFADKQFDCVVLSQALQAVRDVEAIIDDMLRVGRQCIVSFPNFAYTRYRRRLADEGRAPKPGGPGTCEWYDTPDIRFLSIADFEDFCLARRIEVHRRIALDTENTRQIDDDPNLNADLAIFVLSR